MNKNILVGLALTASFTLCAQTFPDGSFEKNWEFFTNPNPGKTDYWDFKDDYFLSTLNQLHELSGDQGDAPLTAFRTEDAIDGNYALKLVSNTMTFGEKLFLPGAAATLHIDFIGMDCIMGKPFTHKPLQFTGWYKCQLVKGDSAAIEVFLKKGGTKIGGGKMVIYSDVNAWTKFNISIDYSQQSTPDSIVVVFAASAGYDFTSIATLMQCKGQDGSTLYIDDVAFGYEQNVRELMMPETVIIVSPNPAKDNLKLSFEQAINATIFVYDYTGKEIERAIVNGDSYQLNVAKYAKGSYFINVLVNDKLITSKQFIKE